MKASWLILERICAIWSSKMQSMVVDLGDLGAPKRKASWQILERIRTIGSS
jgi:hypothetical protein